VSHNPTLSYQPAKQHRQLTHEKPIPFADCKQQLAKSEEFPAQKGQLLLIKQILDLYKDPANLNLYNLKKRTV